VLADAQQRVQCGGKSLVEIQPYFWERSIHGWLQPSHWVLYIIRRFRKCDSSIISSRMNHDEPTVGTCSIEQLQVLAASTHYHLAIVVLPKIVTYFQGLRLSDWTGTNHSYVRSSQQWVEKLRRYMNSRW
jgi:hypothetical protein